MSLLVMASLVAFAGCGQNDDGPSPGNGGGTSNPYPVERSITNKDGIKLEVTILGRSDSQVFFTSKGKRYDYPIEDLALADRLAVNKLPVKSVPPPPDPTEVREAERKQSYIEFRKQSIERLKRKISDLETKQAQAVSSGDSARQRYYQREISNVNTEITKLESEILNAR